MNKRDLDRLLVAFKAFDKTITTKAAALSALKSQGYLDKSGKVSAPYAAPRKAGKKSAA